MPPPLSRLALLAVLLLAACADPNTRASTTRQAATTPADESLARTYLGEQTRDPEAARIRNIVTWDLGSGDRVLCGEFNGKNAYGGYVGYSAFYLRLRGDTVMASNWGEYGSVYAAQVCAEAASGSIMVQPD